MRQGVGVNEKMSDRVDRAVLNWFGHMKRMSVEQLTDDRGYESFVKRSRYVAALLRGG